MTRHQAAEQIGRPVGWGALGAMLGVAATLLVLAKVPMAFGQTEQRITALEKTVPALETRFTASMDRIETKLDTLIWRMVPAPPSMSLPHTGGTP